MRKWQAPWTVLLALVVGGLMAAPAAAEIVIYTGDGDVPLAGNLPAATAGEIRVGCTPVLEVPGPGGGVPLAVRAEILDTRMTAILSAAEPGPVWIGAIRGKPTLWVGAYRLITVYPEDARATGVSMRALAAQWAAQVRRALARAHPVLGPGPQDYPAGAPGH